MTKTYRELSYAEAQTLWDCGHRSIEWIPSNPGPVNWLWTPLQERPDAFRDSELSLRYMVNTYMKKFRIEVSEDDEDLP